MKQFIISALLACTAVCIANAQFSNEYEPSSAWPYMYEDFKEAIVYYQTGNPESARINVHLLKNELHFTDGEKIMIVHDAYNIDSVVCEDGKVLLRRTNLYITQAGKTSRIVVGHSCEGDLHALDDSNGAYGTRTSTGATNDVSSFDNEGAYGLHGQHGNMAVNRYKDMRANHLSSRTLPTIKRTLFIIDDSMICHATKGGVNKILDKEQKKAFNKFLKENKIRWKETDDLLLVAQFLETIIPVEEY